MPKRAAQHQMPHTRSALAASADFSRMGASLELNVLNEGWLTMGGEWWKCVAEDSGGGAEDLLYPIAVNSPVADQIFTSSSGGHRLNAIHPVHGKPISTYLRERTNRNRLAQICIRPCQARRCADSGLGFRDSMKY